MYIVLAVIIAAIVSLAVGFSVEQVYGQANMTAATNMTADSSNMTATEDDNITKGSVSGGLAVSDPGTGGSKK
ncbi:MAG: hypothetical protein ACRD8W_16120 [Nitrososphaeraceae archaeon]